MSLDEVLDLGLWALTNCFYMSVDRSGQAHRKLKAELNVVITRRAKTSRESVHRLTVVEELFLHLVTLMALYCLISFLLGPVTCESGLFFTFDLNFNKFHLNRLDDANHNEALHPVAGFVEREFRLDIDTGLCEKGVDLKRNPITFI